jgi:hypothetical protein
LSETESSARRMAADIRSGPPSRVRREAAGSAVVDDTASAP